MNHYIYKITICDPGSELDGHFYIGKRSTLEDVSEDNYWGSGSILLNYEKIKGIQNLTKEILETCSTVEELNIKEKEYIKNSYDDPYCMNLAHGGDGGDTGERTKKIISQKTKKMWKEHPEMKEQFSKMFADLWKDPEYRKKTLEANKKKNFGLGPTGKWSEERRQKVKRTLAKNKELGINKPGPKGYKFSEEQIRKRSEKVKNYKWFTNGKENTTCLKCPDGWYPGRTNKKGSE